MQSTHLPNGYGKFHLVWTKRTRGKTKELVWSSSHRTFADAAAELEIVKRNRPDIHAWVVDTQGR